MSEATGIYLQPWVTRHIDPAVVHTIVEVGACNGMDALALSDRYKARVYCFECNPEAIPECETNLADQPLVTLIKKAVSDEDGRIDFFPVAGSIGASSIFQSLGDYPYDPLTQTRIQVEATRLDSWMQESGTPKIDMLCIDAQGATLKVLKGLGSKLREIRYVVAEVETKRIYAGEPLLLDVQTYLEEHGFALATQRLVNETFGDYVFVNKMNGMLYHLLRGRTISERDVEWPFVLSRVPLPAKPRALDVGCCENDFAAMLTTFGYEMWGVDLRDFSCPVVHFSKEDARSLSFSDDFFDLVMSVSTIEHVGLVVTPYNTDTECDEDGDIKVFNEMVRVTKPGGTILLTIPYGICNDHENPWPATSTLWIRFYDKARVKRLLANKLFVTDELQYTIMENDTWHEVTEKVAGKHVTTLGVSANLCIRGHRV